MALEQRQSIAQIVKRVETAAKRVAAMKESQRPLLIRRAEEKAASAVKLCYRGTDLLVQLLLIVGRSGRNESSLEPAESVTRRFHQLGLALFDLAEFQVFLDRVEGAEES